ncbi:DUF4436 family protein [Rhodococcus sp. G-MC3]|uniref:DUF4436 family protein n=1 Tax=Rhodococcus sp. G-MC3 TaxID=3046209 RepID=UPI0024BB4E03|nr:DUF4436 family protein [Rhodococcus sp. G-MC3]MDJ0394138.1 DUF4436 family protein [Rhodococcus sp. G-MC3]
MNLFDRLSSRWRVVGITAVVALVYVGILVAYGLSNADDAVDTRAPDPAGVLVYLDVGSVDGEAFSVDAKVSVYPGQDLVSNYGYLKDDLLIDLAPLASGGRLVFSAGTAPSPSPSTIYSDGDIRTWPFDSYHAESVVVRAFSESGAARTPVPAVVAVTDSLTGWSVDSDGDHTGGDKFDITVSRNGVSKVYDLAICMVLVALPMCALFVAVNTVRRRKKFQPPMVTWFAVMLFAVLPIRNLLPGAPPIGSWVDYAVVLWVVLGLVTAMILYVCTWWRDAP